MVQPEDISTFTIGDVTARVWDAGWQSAWGLANRDVHGARVELEWTYGETYSTTCVYGPVLFRDSVANAEAGKGINLREAASAVADELASYAADPDEFESLVLEGITPENAEEKLDTIHKLRNAEPIGSELLDLSEGDPEWFERWGNDDS